MKRNSRKSTKWALLVAGIVVIALVGGVIAALSDPDKRNGSFDYNVAAEAFIKADYYPNADVKSGSSKIWDNTGFKEVQGVFEDNDVNYSFHARFADQDIVLLDINGDKKFSDIDRMTEFMDSQDKK